MSSILVTMFAATSKAGRELALALKPTLESMKINNLPITVNIIWEKPRHGGWISRNVDDLGMGYYEEDFRH